MSHSIRRKSHNFIERSILGALCFLKESIFAEEFAAREGFLQSLDPRVKTITFFAILISMAFVKSITALLCFYAFSFILARLSKISLIYFLERTWIFIPLFSLFIAIPALFDIFSPGDALFCFRLGSLTLTVTHQGFFGAILFVSRVASAVSFVILLTLTTRHTELLNALRFFKISQTFVMVIGMCYRYIYLFAGIIEDTYRAIKSRVGTQIHHHKGQRIVAWNIACLWQRSYLLNQAVYQAMLSRGYCGEPRVLNEFHARARDWWWVSAVFLFFFLMIWIGYRTKI